MTDSSLCFPEKHRGVLSKLNNAPSKFRKDSLDSNVFIPYDRTCVGPRPDLDTVGENLVASGLAAEDVYAYLPKGGAVKVKAISDAMNISVADLRPFLQRIVQSKPDVVFKVPTPTYDEAYLANLTKRIAPFGPNTSLCVANAHATPSELLQNYDRLVKAFTRDMGGRQVQQPRQRNFGDAVVRVLHKQVDVTDPKVWEDVVSLSRQSDANPLCMLPRQFVPGGYGLIVRKSDVKTIAPSPRDKDVCAIIALLASAKAVVEESAPPQQHHASSSSPSDASDVFTVAKKDVTIAMERTYPEQYAHYVREDTRNQSRQLERRAQAAGLLLTEAGVRGEWFVCDEGYEFLLRADVKAILAAIANPPAPVAPDAATDSNTVHQNNIIPIPADMPTTDPSEVNASQAEVERDATHQAAATSSTTPAEVEREDAHQTAATSSTTPAATSNAQPIIPAPTPTQPQKHDEAGASVPPYPYKAVCELLMGRAKQPVTGEKRTKHEFQKMRSNPKDLNPRCRDIATELTKLFGMEFPNTLEAWNELTRLSNGELVLDPPVPANPFFPEASFFCPKEDVASYALLGDRSSFVVARYNMLLVCLVNASQHNVGSVVALSDMMDVFTRIYPTIASCEKDGKVSILQLTGAALLNGDFIILTMCGMEWYSQKICAKSLKCIEWACSNVLQHLYLNDESTNAQCINTYTSVPIDNTIDILGYLHFYGLISRISGNGNWVLSSKARELI